MCILYKEFQGLAKFYIQLQLKLFLTQAQVLDCAQLNFNFLRIKQLGFLKLNAVKNLNVLSLQFIIRARVSQQKISLKNVQVNSQIDFLS